MRNGAQNDWEGNAIKAQNTHSTRTTTATTTTKTTSMMNSTTNYFIVVTAAQIALIQPMRYYSHHIIRVWKNEMKAYTQ